MIDSTIENTAIIVRTLAAVPNKNTWNVEHVSPRKFISAEIEGFTSELEMYLVCLVE